jgi:DNA-nicking Smr family endonuclease
MVRSDRALRAQVAAWVQERRRARALAAAAATAGGG